MTGDGDKARHPRPRKGRPALTREERSFMKRRISETAGRLFRTKGYAHVSMRRIAREIGCSPMTLYTYYDSKIEILRTLWDEVFADLFGRLDNLDLNDKPPVEQLIIASEAYIDYWLQNRDQYQLVFATEGTTKPDVTLYLDSSQTAPRYLIFWSLIEGASDTDQRPEDIRIKLDALVCAMHGIIHSLITMGGYKWSDPKAMIEVITTGVVKA